MVGKKKLATKTKEKSLRATALHVIDRTAPTPVKFIVLRDHKALLYSATGHGDTNEIAKLLSAEYDANPLDPNQYDSMAMTPLHIAALKDDVNVARLLIAYGADADAKGSNFVGRGNRMRNLVVFTKIR